MMSMSEHRTEDDSQLSELKPELDELKQRLSTFEGQTAQDDDEHHNSPGEVILARFSLQSIRHGAQFHLLPPRCSPFPDGILSFLNKAYSGNVHDRGTIRAFAECPFDTGGNNAPRNVVDVGTDTYFLSKNEVNQNIGYYFNNLRVTPTHYALRSCGEKVGGQHPQTWVVESSDDGVNWIEIDSRRNTTELDGPHQIGVFQVNEIRETRFIRIRQTEPNRAGNNHLTFTAFELFGSVRMMD
jgi:hypothetical protein